MISTSYQSEGNTIVNSDSRHTIGDMENKNIYVAIYSTSLLLYTFFNTFTLAYISYYNDLEDSVLGVCIYFNVIYTILFIYLFWTYIHRYLLVSITVYVLNFCISCVMLGFVNNSKGPIIYNIIYSWIHTIIITFILCKRQTHAVLTTESSFSSTSGNTSNFLSPATGYNTPFNNQYNSMV